MSSIKYVDKNSHGFFAMPNVGDVFHESVVICSCCGGPILNDEGHCQEINFVVKVPERCPHCKAKLDGRIVTSKENFLFLKDELHQIAELS